MIRFGLTQSVSEPGALLLPLKSCYKGSEKMAWKVGLKLTPVFLMTKGVFVSLEKLKATATSIADATLIYKN